MEAAGGRCCECGGGRGRGGATAAAAAPPVAAVWLSLPNSSRQRVLIHSSFSSAFSAFRWYTRSDVQTSNTYLWPLYGSLLITLLHTCKLITPFGMENAGQVCIVSPGPAYSSFAVHSLPGNRTFGVGQSFSVLFAGVVLEPHEPRR